MKKKILLVGAMFLCFAGIVHASSINGDYKGNPIVLVKSDGKVLNPIDVPAQIYNDNTVVPISMLRQLGASVTWDQNTYSVDVKLPNNNDESNILKNFVIEAESELPKSTVKEVSFDIKPNGTYFHIVYSENMDVSKEQQATNLFALASLVGILPTPIEGAIIDAVSGVGNNIDVRYTIPYNSVDFANDKIDRTAFYRTWNVKINQ